MVLSNICSKHLTKILYENGKIQPEFREAYQYSIDLAMDFVLFHGSLILLGLLTGHFLSVCIYIITMTPLKTLAGGAHAKTPLMCSIISYSVFFLTIYAVPTIRISSELSFVAIILLGILIFTHAPVNHPNKQFSENQRKRIRNVLLIYLITGSIINLILLIFQSEDLLIIALCCYLITYFNQMIGLILYREVNTK